MDSDAPSATRFEYRGWLVEIEVTSADAGLFAGHADLRFDGSHKCRVTLATARLDSSAARWALDSKARDFIDEWTSRPRPKPSIADDDEGIQ
jgi:hypothetical protein